MIFINKIKLLQVLFFLLFLFSCSNRKNEKILIKKENGLPLMNAVIEDNKKLPSNINLKKNQIHQFFIKNWPNNSLNGGFLVALNGKIIYEKYQGYANFNTKTKITPNTPLHIASVTKVITATAILKLIDAKKIDLNQKVTTILKELPYPEITIKTLLNHRSGLRNYSYFTDKKDIWDKHNILTNKDLLTLLATKNLGLEYKTDTHFSYSNTNYALLALIIEKITGLKYKDAVKKMIFDPLKMKNSYVFDIKKDKEKAVPSYKGNKKQIGFDYLDAIYGDKNIYSTPRDLLKLDCARRSPSFINLNLLKQIYTGFSNEYKGQKNYGLGIRMIKWKNGKTLYYHNGWWHGSTSSYIHLKEENLTIIALSNKFSRKPYNIRKLTSLFGNYPFDLNKDKFED